MRHPLDFSSHEFRKRYFYLFLILTLSLFAIFRILDKPLQTDYAPNGIISFELAGTTQNAAHMVLTWTEEAVLKAAFGLGLDYLFMPVYAFTLAFGTLLAAGRHSGWYRSLGAVAGYGAFSAALFDAVENYALFQVLLGAFNSPYPAIAAVCATAKFLLLIFGVLYAAVGGVIPKHKSNRQVGITGS